jgi:hypothetical protein
VWAVKVSVAWCQPMVLMQVVGWEGNVVLGAVWRQLLCDRRNSNWCDSKTQENNHMNKVGGKGKEVQYLINTRII